MHRLFIKTGEYMNIEKILYGLHNSAQTVYLDSSSIRTTFSITYSNLPENSVISAKHRSLKLSSPVSLWPPGASYVSRSLCLQNTHFPLLKLLYSIKKLYNLFYTFVRFFITDCRPVISVMAKHHFMNIISIHMV